MEITDKEKERIKAILEYFVSKQRKVSGGHNGLSISLFNGLLSICLSELEEEGKIVGRRTLNRTSYFLK